MATNQRITRGLKMALLKIELLKTEVQSPLQAGITTDNFHQVMEQVYLDWVNNYVSIESFANAYGVSQDHAKAMIEIGKRGSIWS